MLPWQVSNISVNTLNILFTAAGVSVSLLQTTQLHMTQVQVIHQTGYFPFGVIPHCRLSRNGKNKIIFHRKQLIDTVV